MLLVTDQAASVCRDILARDDVQGNAIRLTPDVGDDGTKRISIMAIDEPTASDVPTQADGVDVFVTPDLAPEVDGSVLDAEGDAEAARLILKPAS